VPAARLLKVNVKVCVFVDGENFRHSIVDLFPQFHQEDYLPKLANWTNLFDWIVKSVDENGERIRTYWYVVESLDCFPYNFPDPTVHAIPDRIKEETNKLCKLLSKHPPYKTKIDTLAEGALLDFATKTVNELKRHESIMRGRFNGWIAMQNGISLKHKAIEFRRAGAISYNLFDSTLGKEKAVDVKLATDMIMLKDIYDLAIIVTGDQDYVPAAKVIKDCGKRVVNVAFMTRSGTLLPGGARRLNQVTDWSFDIPFSDLSDHLQIGQLPLARQ
jgi:uncharacterized LabA/DUF88 family protein